MDILHETIQKAENLKYTDIILGWFLGLCSVIFIEFIRRKIELSEFRRGLATEIKEIKKTLTLYAFQFKDRIGELDMDFLTWCDLRFKEDKETEQFGTIANLLSLKENNLENYNIIQKSKKRAYKGKSINLFYLNSKINNISLLKLREQDVIIQIMRRINNLNEEIEFSHYYFNLTFDSSITTENYKIANNNFIDNCRNISTQSRIIVDLMLELQKEFHKGKNGFLTYLKEKITKWRTC